MDPGSPSAVRGVNGLAMLDNFGRGWAASSHLDDERTHAFQVIFQSNDDGRTRALLHTYQVVDASAVGGSSHQVIANSVSVDADGQLEVDAADVPAHDPGPDQARSGRLMLARLTGLVALLACAVACGGSAAPPVTAAGSPGPTPSASTSPGPPVCAPLSRFSVASVLLSNQLGATPVPHPPSYLQHVLDTAVDALHATRPLVGGTTADDVDAQISYWTVLRSTLATDGYQPSELTAAQSRTLDQEAGRVGSQAAGDRLRAYALATCGPGINPTPQQLGSFS